MTFAQALLATAAGITLIAGYRRSRYDGTPPRVWWAQERQYRRPRSILARLLRVATAAWLLVAAGVAGITAIGVLAISAAVVGLLGCAWWWLRRAATTAEPPVSPVERLAAGDLTPEDLDRHQARTPHTPIEEK